MFSWVLAFVAISILINIVTIGIIFQNKEQAQNRLTWFLIGSIISIMFWVINNYYQLRSNIEDQTMLYVISIGLANGIILFGLILLTGVSRLLIDPHLDFKRMVYLSLISGIIVGLDFAIMLLGFNDEITQIPGILSLSDVFNVIFIISVLLFIAGDMRTLLKEDLSDLQRKQVHWLFGSILVGFAGTFPFQLLSIFYPDVEAISYVVVAVAMILVAKSYSIDPRIAFVIPHRVYLVVVVNKTGIMKYSHEFKKGWATDPILISGAITAVASIFSEFYNTNVYLKQIDFMKSKILVKWDKEYFIALFTDKDSDVIVSGLNNFMKFINAKYGDKLEEIMDDPMELDLNQEVKKAFYFVY